MKKNIKRLTLSALASAIICVVIYLLPVPMPSGWGYVNIGDTFIYLFACLLPMPYGIFAAAIGASVADLLAGYSVYAVPTFIIKLLMAAAFTNKKSAYSARNIACVIPAGIILVGGYFVTERLLTGSWVTAAANLPFNALQAGINAVLFIVIALLTKKIRPFYLLRDDLK